MQASGRKRSVNEGDRSQRPTFLYRLWHPMSWPRWMRRIFMLSLPLALSVWVAFNLIAALGAALRDIGGFLDKYWNGKPRRYHRYRKEYGYLRERRGGAPRSDEDVDRTEK